MIATLFGKLDNKLWEVSVDIENGASDGKLRFYYEAMHNTLMNEKVKPEYWIFWDTHDFDRGDITEDEFVAHIKK